MARGTQDRDYDLGRTIAKLVADVAFLMRRIKAYQLLIPDQAWQSIAVIAGFTSALQYRRRGQRVTIRGTITPSVDWGAVNSLQMPVAVGTLPVGVAPPVSHTIVCATSAGQATVVFRVVIQSNGGIQVRCNTAAHPSAVNINFDYLMDD